jgi:hypothetical protein
VSETPPPTPQWDFGKRIEKARGSMSTRAAAKLAGLSEGRWRQLEDGYQKLGGYVVPARPTRRTVIGIADAFGIPRAELLLLAGIEPQPADETVADVVEADDFVAHGERSLATLSDEALIQELQRVTEELARRRRHGGDT